MMRSERSPRLTFTPSPASVSASTSRLQPDLRSASAGALETINNNQSGSAQGAGLRENLSPACR